MLVVMLTRPAVDQLFIRNCWYPLLGINCGWKIPWQMEVFSWEHHCINGYKWWIFGSIPHFFLASSRETGSKFCLISLFFGTVYYYWLCRGSSWSFWQIISRCFKRSNARGTTFLMVFHPKHQSTIINQPLLKFIKIVFLFRNHYYYPNQPSTINQLAWGHGRIAPSSWWRRWACPGAARNGWRSETGRRRLRKNWSGYDSYSYFKI